ncbi:multidrug resistance-associated protein 4-like isoform X1 [Sebastes umbrosus]|uniref:multidrug resistance-associated protein 4-like isoform X1 n=1 Tax=Sebastes umbrosus TaxID=72105 RepID=UPI0018A0D514|nr:multidrug resistance-associated protein 4-like isoform X1 [Sebastes umbrosus]
MCPAARSPVFSHLSSSLQGLWTIRAFGAEERFQKAFNAQQDLHSEAWFLLLTTSRWFAVRLHGICSIFVTVTTFGRLLLRDLDGVWREADRSTITGAKQCTAVDGAGSKTHFRNMNKISISLSVCYI